MFISENVRNSKSSDYVTLTMSNENKHGRNNKGPPLLVSDLKVQEPPGTEYILSLQVVDLHHRVPGLAQCVLGDAQCLLGDVESLLSSVLNSGRLLLLSVQTTNSINQSINLFYILAIVKTITGRVLIYDSTVYT